jgi:hypothetical protein
MGGKDIRSEERSQQIAHDSSHSMLTEDIKGVVYANQVLQFSRIIASDSANDTEDNGRPSGYESGCGGDRNKTCNSSESAYLGQEGCRSIGPSKGFSVFFHNVSEGLRQ